MIDHAIYFVNISCFPQFIHLLVHNLSTICNFCLLEDDPSLAILFLLKGSLRFLNALCTIRVSANRLHELEEGQGGLR